MICEYCHQLGTHDYRCPNYIPYKAKIYCCECGEGIYTGDEYIQNDNGECIHVECVPGIRWMVNWLEYDIRTMDEDYGLD